jgi:hypothetical protein
MDNSVTVRQGNGLTSELIAATDMASGQCVKVVKGAKYLPHTNWFFNKHILALK